VPIIKRYEAKASTGLPRRQSQQRRCPSVLSKVFCRTEAPAVASNVKAELGSMFRSLRPAPIGSANLDDVLSSIADILSQNSGSCYDACRLDSLARSAG
jgi:hypothetical protein